jgi:hypothetical protein
VNWQTRPLNRLVRIELKSIASILAAAKFKSAKDASWRDYRDR